MLKRLLSMLGQRAAAGMPDLTRFGDPLATRTAWTPVKTGGASFRTHALRRTGATRIEFRPTGAALGFCLVFIVMGLAPLIGALFTPGSTKSPGPLFVLLFSVVFSGVGGYMLFSLSVPIVFDRQLGYFWVGWRKPGTPSERSGIATLVPLTRIRAFQILSEHVRGNKSSYYSYELNLVLEDASRINVVDHGNLETLRNDAQQLATLLGVPVWDVA